MRHDIAFELLPFTTETESEDEREGEWEEERHHSRPGRAAAGTRARPRPLPPSLPRRGSRWPHPAWSAPAATTPCICPVHATEYVRWIQSALNQTEGLQLPIDGVMSAATRSALRTFQSRQGLPADGIAGPDTEDALRQARSHPAPASGLRATEDTLTGEVFEYETLELETPAARQPTLRRGSSGSAVADLQQRLARAGFSPGPIDGIFGPQTDRAVRSFQQARGLVVDGIVGPQTWGALSSGARPPGPPVPPGRRPGWRVAEALLRLRTQVNALAPRRNTSSDGTIGDAAHAARQSDHNPWVKDGQTGIVTALDITHDPAGGCDAGKLAEAIVISRDRRIKYIIWNRRIISATSIDGHAPWTWRTYNGSNPHTQHVHVSVRPDKPFYDDTSPWTIR